MKPVNAFAVNRPAVVLSKRTIWLIRILLVIIIGGWISLAVYLHRQVAQSRAKVERNRALAAQEERRIRRNAAYQYELQERGNVRVQNAVTGN